MTDDFDLIDWRETECAPEDTEDRTPFVIAYAFFTVTGMVLGGLVVAVCMGAFS